MLLSQSPGLLKEWMDEKKRCRSSVFFDKAGA